MIAQSTVIVSIIFTYRNHALVVVGVYTVLRISDLLQLKWPDVYDEKTERFRQHLIITEQKTGKRKIIAMNKHVIHALRLCLPYKCSAYIFASRRGGKPISRV